MMVSQHSEGGHREKPAPFIAAFAAASPPAAIPEATPARTESLARTMGLVAVRQTVGHQQPDASYDEDSKGSLAGKSITENTSSR